MCESRRDCVVYMQSSLDYSMIIAQSRRDVNDMCGSRLDYNDMCGSHSIFAGVGLDKQRVL